jgi:starch phosphorylase
MAITLSQAPSRLMVPFLTPPSFRRSSSRVKSFCGCRLGGPGSFFFVHGQRTRASASNTNYIFGVDVRACVLPIRKTVRATGVQQLSSEPLEGGETDSETVIRIVIDNEMDESCTSIDIISPNWPGILACVTLRFRDLDLQVVKASVELKDGFVFHKFLVTDNRGLKPQDAKTLNMIEKGLHAALDPVLWPELTTDGKLTKGVGLVGNPELQRRRRLMWLMDQYLKNDVLSIQKSIVDHVEYTIARSRFKFDDFEAYKATANSVRDRLIESWNDNQQFHRNMDSKRVYYLSMEFLMGRSLLNSIFNLGIKEQYAQALNELGYNLEVVVEQERDAALGNGGLGRLAACFLDSLATMNYSAWGYGIRYQYGLFRQTLQDGFQHEQPDYWLNVGNPWEIERVHVTYPISVSPLSPQ